MYNLKKENVTHASSRSTAQNQCTWTRVTTFNKVGDKMYVGYFIYISKKSKVGFVILRPLEDLTF